MSAAAATAPAARPPLTAERRAVYGRTVFGSNPGAGCDLLAAAVRARPQVGGRIEPGDRTLVVDGAS